jgi:hypothetical protein
MEMVMTIRRMDSPSVTRPTRQLRRSGLHYDEIRRPLRQTRILTPALKFVHEPVLVVGEQDRDGLITAFIEVENVKALYAEYVAAGATFDQKLKKQAWGGRDFVVRDLDGNGLCFVGPAA